MMRKLLLSMLLLSGIGLMPSFGIAAMSDEIDVTLEIVDGQGRGVPYATVWGYVLPSTRESSATGAVPIGAEDLWRLTTRYQSSFEFAMPFNKPVGYLIVYPMADNNGKLTVKIDYKRLEGSDAKRPDKMSVGFAVMKRGYLPARIDFSVASESEVSGKVILQRDPENAPESQPYLVEFERLRYELSDPRRNEDISEKNHQRIERLRAELEAAARRAVEAGDKKAAARIYARMEFLPSIRFINGKAAGFSQSDPSSEQSRAYLERAYSLDPANSYVAVKILFREGSQRFGGNKHIPEKATDEQQRAFTEYLDRLHAFMRAYSAEIWPGYRELYALWHRKSSNPKERERMVPLLEELYRIEPKFQTHDKLLQVNY